MMVSIIALALSLLSSTPVHATLNSHAPIYINYNDNFTVANGVNGGGSGTLNDPFIIENWVISASSANGIDIRNTTAYFIIRNCLVENGSSSHYGIYFENVANGKIENCTINGSNSTDGINFWSSSYNTLTNNTCSNNRAGIMLRWFSSYNTLTNNTCSSNGEGIGTESSTNNTLTNNTCNNNRGYGIEDWNSCPNNTLTNNTCSNNLWSGIYLRSSNWTLDNNTCSNNGEYGTQSNSANLLVTNNICDNNRWGGIYGESFSNSSLMNNTCSNNSGSGIYLRGINSSLMNNTCSNNSGSGIEINGYSDTLTNNTCSNNSYGIYFDYSGSLVCHNYIINNTTQAYDASTNNWDNGYPSGGNYWSDWQPPQHPDTNGDGLAQDPRPIAGGTNKDTYPLVPPNFAPNKPTNLQPSTRQITTNVVMSCAVTDNDNNRINVFFYDNSTKSIIDNIWISSGATATRTWSGLARGSTCTFFARGQDNNGAWGDNSDTCTFRVNALPAASNQLADNQTNPLHLTDFTPTLSWSYSDADSDPQIQRQIQVGTSENGNDMWDSTVSTSSTSAVYAGPALSKSVTYYWRVRVYDNYEWSSWLYGGTFGLYPPFAPIYINGNTQFTSANGVTSGSGTASDPYIIENWVISASSANGIDIENTTAYFVIRNGLIENGGGSYYGIKLDKVVNGRVENCTCKNDDYGILLITNSDNNILTNNTCENNIWYGIRLEYSSNNALTNNTCENGGGIYLYDSENIKMRNNTLSNNRYNFGMEGTTLSHFVHDIDNSNLVNEKPIRYLMGQSNEVIGPSLEMGYLGLVNCDNIRVENIVLKHNIQGILIASTKDSRVENCTFENNGWGIYLWGSDNNILTNNTCDENGGGGIGLLYSNNNIITINSCENNIWYGIRLEYSDSNMIKNSTFSSENEYGVRLYSSDNNIIEYNTISNNNRDGIWFEYDSVNNTIRNNKVTSNNSYGIYILNSNDNNRIYHNNFVNNENQAYDNGSNYWDNGYPSGGNYWSDYTGVDNYRGENQDTPGSDGIWDAPYAITGDNNRDRYPLMGLDMVAGWNLVNLWENDAPDNIFFGQPYYIWMWDAVNRKYVSPSPTAPVELAVGYWIWVGENTTVATSGVPVDTYSENLKNGWNLVGFPLTSANTTPNNLFADQTYYIWMWDAVNRKYVSPSPTAPVELAVGYWIWVDHDQTVTVP
jgi:parallel beta-helix repeat protein